MSIVCACASIMFVTLVIALVVVLYKRFGKSHGSVLEQRSLNNSSVGGKSESYDKNVDYNGRQPATEAPYLAAGEVFSSKFQQPLSSAGHKHLKDFPMKDLNSKDSSYLCDRSTDFNFHTFGDKRCHSTTGGGSVTTNRSLANAPHKSKDQVRTQGGYATIEYRQQICRPSPETPSCRSRGFGSKVSQSATAFNPARDGDIPPVQPDILSCSPRRKTERPLTFVSFESKNYRRMSN